MAKRRYCLEMTKHFYPDEVKVKKRWFNNINSAFDCCDNLATQRINELYTTSDIKGWSTTRTIVMNDNATKIFWGIYLTIHKWDGSEVCNMIAHIYDRANEY